MASLKYLWQNRATFSVKSLNFYRAWSKRAVLLPEILNRNQRRWKLVRQGSIINESAEIGEVVVEGHKNKFKVGALTFIGKAYIALHEQVKIGDRVCINDGVEILTASHNVSDPNWNLVQGKVIIEDYAWIGTGAMLLPGVIIGRGAVVGARAVVSKSVPAGAIVVGNPAKPIEKTRCSDLDYNPCEFLAGNRAWLLG